MTKSKALGLSGPHCAQMPLEPGVPPNDASALPHHAPVCCRDALEEVFVQCSPRDLLALRSTCRAASELLGKSERVWLAKLRESFGLHLRTIKVGQDRCMEGRGVLEAVGETPVLAGNCTVIDRGWCSLGAKLVKRANDAGHISLPPGLQSLAASQDGLYMRLARRVFEASRAQQLRFQGVYVGGGVDEVRSRGASDGIAHGGQTCCPRGQAVQERGSGPCRVGAHGGLPLTCREDGTALRLPRRALRPSTSHLILPCRPSACLPVCPQDAMHYFVDNLFRPDKAPYCSNCSRDADCVALLLVSRRTARTLGGRGTPCRATQAGAPLTGGGTRAPGARTANPRATPALRARCMPPVGGSAVCM